MPGFIGGSSSGSGSGGEISFPKEFIDPVTKFRVSQPENLIDTDFEYGLQPTKWETVELINNTPSFFSKSGDTTIPGILAISTNSGTREITVTTSTDHGLAVGIPINVTGTKSVTADGSYIINSIPNLTTFTYLCKDNQQGNSAIEDLYTSIITGEFFQGSQIRISDSEGVVTDGAPISTLTVKTDSTHGFGLNTPFYFLNLNSTISQEFEASNTAAKSFDSSNSATAQTFDGSNTLSTFNIDWSNSATVGGTTSTISSVSTVNDTITVTHGAETFANKPIGTPLYYALTVPASSGYFLNNPRGVVFLKTTGTLNVGGLSTFQVSDTPDGAAIDIVSNMSGTFQLANQARAFAGNNRDPVTEIPITLIRDNALQFDGGNQGFTGAVGDAFINGVCTAIGYTATDILVSVTAGAGLDYYVGSMVFYSSTGTAATGLTNNTTYFVAQITAAGGNLYNIRLKNLPTDASTLTPSGGSGVQTISKIGVSIDKNIFHVKNSQLAVYDMLEYEYPAAGNFLSNYQQKFYFVETVYDTHNFTVAESTFIPITATGGTILPNIYSAGRFFRVHTFTAVGSSAFVVTEAPSGSTVEYLVVGGGGGGGMDMGGGGGGGGVLSGTVSVSAQSYPIVVGDGGLSSGQPYASRNADSAGVSGSPSSAFGVTALGGAGGAGSHDGNQGPARTGGSSGGGASGQNANQSAGTAGQGFAGGTTGGQWYSGGGGGAGGVGSNGGSNPQGGIGIVSSILGPSYYFGGGGGGSGYSQGGGNGGRGGGGGGGRWSAGSNGVGNTEGLNPGGNATGADYSGYGGSGGVNTGGGAGGHAHQATTNSRKGGSGIVVVRYPITPVPSANNPYPVATGGGVTTLTVGNDIYAVHSFTNTGSQSLVVSQPGNAATGSSTLEYLVVGGGGSGGSDMGGGGGAGGYLAGSFTATATTYAVVVGAGGSGDNQGVGNRRGWEGGNSSLVGGGTNLVAFGGGGGASNHDRGNNPAGGVNNGQTVGSGGGCSGGGGGAQDNRSPDGAYGGSRRGTGTAGQGNAGGSGSGTWYPGGGGGSAGAGTSNPPKGGAGTLNNILGPGYYWAAGGGGSNYSAFQDNSGGIGGGGGGAANNFDNRGTGGINTANPGGYGSINSQTNVPGGSAGANTGSGGGGGSHYSGNNYGGFGGSGIVVVRYKVGTVV